MIEMEGETDRNLASFSRRAGAFLIDAAAVGFIWFASAVVAAIPGNDPDTDGFSEPWDTIVTIIIVALPAYWFVYQWVCNALGVSLGKKLLSLSIEARAYGERPGVGRGLVRTIGQIVGAVPLGFGFWAALWHPANAAWHDTLAGTRVVRGAIERERVPEPVERDAIRRRLERVSVRQRVPTEQGKNLRFLCDPAPDANSPAYVELRRKGVRFEDEHGLRGVRYDEIEGVTKRPSGEIELRFKSRDMFGRPTRDAVLLGVQDAGRFMLELGPRVEAATGRPLVTPGERPGLSLPPT